MPKVPQEVPEAKARITATTKITAGSMLYRPVAAPSMTLCTKSAAPSIPVMLFRETARVRMVMAGTMEMKPLGTHSMAALKVMTRRQSM